MAVSKTNSSAVLTSHVEISFTHGTVDSGVRKGFGCELKHSLEHARHRLGLQQSFPSQVKPEMVNFAAVPMLV